MSRFQKNRVVFWTIFIDQLIRGQRFWEVVCFTANKQTDDSRRARGKLPLEEEYHNTRCSVCAAMQVGPGRGFWVRTGSSRPALAPEARQFCDFCLCKYNKVLLIWLVYQCSRCVQRSSQVIKETHERFCSLNFYFPWVSKTQPNHWTKRMMNTRLTT